MPQPNKIPKPFAASGDKNTIPESTETIGLASWNEGFPAITSTPFAEGGLAPKRTDFNGIFNALSLATLWQQQGGVYAYDNTTDYEVGNIVLYSGNLYKCLIANGPSSSVQAPTDANAWGKIITTNDNVELVLNASIATDGYVKYSSGLQLCWGVVSAKTSPVAVSFPRAFAYSPRIVTGTKGLVNTNVAIAKAGVISATGFTPILVWNGQFLDGTFDYLAIGQGA